MSKGEFTTQEQEPRDILNIDGVILERVSSFGESLLSSVVGTEAVKLLEERGLKLYDAPEELLDVVGDEFKKGVVVPYFVPIDDRLLVVSVHARDFELYGERSVDVDFLKQEDLQKLLNVEPKDAFTNESEFGLGGNTLSFLRFSKELVQSISPECKINIKASTPQRDRIYKKALGDLPNVHFLDNSLAEAT
jgi:hypothetical protein